LTEMRVSKAWIGALIFHPFALSCRSLFSDELQKLSCA
jgi:hypothetical protein